MKRAVAIISGGPDSTGYAAIWKSRGYEIYPTIFNYGQKGIKEVEVAIDLSRRLGFNEPGVIDISFMRELWRSALTTEEMEVSETYSRNLVVPIRNIVFLTIASAYAYTIGAEKVICGSQLDDCKMADDGKPMYPDCTVRSHMLLEETVNVSHLWSEKRIEIWSPAREGWTKSELLKRSYELMKDLIFETWSCYLSGEKHCGVCESCKSRKKAFLEARIEDKTEYES